MTPFENASERSLLDLAAAAGRRALADADCDAADVDSLHVGTMLAEASNKRAGLANALTAALGVEGASADRVSNTSATGASAVLRGVHAVESGAAEAALVVGAERMSAGDTAAGTDAISRLTHEREYVQGLTLPSFGGLAADAYLRRYDVSRETLAEVAVKNHANAVDNEYAQFHKEISVADVLDSPPIAEPLRLYDCCPMTDGAAALLLMPDEGDVRVSSIVSATGSHAVAERADPLEIESVRRAGNRAFERAELSRSDVDFACIHDAFSVLEWLELEELGFYDAGTAWEATASGETDRTGEFPVNPGGGLKARGHPLGATGISQIIEAVWQLRGDLPAERRVTGSSETALAINVAGFGNNAVCTLLEGSA